MARILAVVSTTDQTFRADVTRLLRASGGAVAVAEERQFSHGTAPQLAVADVRSGGAAAHAALERLRNAWPAAVIFAVAAEAEPDAILQAMRAGANEFLAWPSASSEALSRDDAFRTALLRTVERLRVSSSTDGRSCRTLSFVGAKGGVGTTTVAVNTAIEIARTSKRPTLIIDLNQFLGEVALFLGVRPRFTLVDALDNLQRVDADFLRELVTRHPSGLDILAGAEQIDRPGPHDGPALEQLLRLLQRTYDFIVIDAGTITNACTEVAVYAADAVYVVANPDVPSIRNTKRLAERLHQLGAGKDRVHVLLNRTSDQHLIAPKQIESTLGHPVHQTFSSDYHTVSAALNSGVPLTLSDHSELAGQFSGFTRTILGFPPETAAPSTRRFAGQFLGLF